MRDDKRDELGDVGSLCTFARNHLGNDLRRSTLGGRGATDEHGYRRVQPIVS